MLRLLPMTVNTSGKVSPRVLRFCGSAGYRSGIPASLLQVDRVGWGMTDHDYGTVVDLTLSPLVSLALLDFTPVRLKIPHRKSRLPSPFSQQQCLCPCKSNPGENLPRGDEVKIFISRHSLADKTRHRLTLSPPPSRIRSPAVSIPPNFLSFHFHNHKSCWDNARGQYGK